MPDKLYNLLIDPLITVTPYGRPAQTLSLPQVLAALGQDEPFEFAALQPHQSHAWHAFLVQLAAIVLHQRGAGLADMLESTQWQEAIREASSGDDSPWTLVVPDLAAPAFMQPPVPEGSVDTWKNSTVTPDAIDLLQTAKNHDVKMERIAVPRPEHWIFALVALQTMEGYGGKENYGIARMNGGYGSRPGFATCADLSWPTRFRRDVDLLLEARDEIAREQSFDFETGLAFVWLQPWDGVQQLDIKELDPFFIEICRRVRLFYDEGRIVARWTTSKRQRLAAAEFKGNLGDPWVPVKVDDSAALTTRRLDYELLQRVLFDGDFKPSRASIPRPGDGNEPLLFCQLFARDQGKTDGYHERLIPIPPKARLRLATEQGRRELGELSKKRLAEIEKVAQALRQAVNALLRGGGDGESKSTNNLISPFIKSFDDEVDHIFFAELFADLELESDVARRKWLRQLLNIARRTLEMAKESAPIPSARLFRARAAADRVFDCHEYSLRKAAGEFLGEGEKDGRTIS